MKPMLGWVAVATGCLAQVGWCASPLDTWTARNSGTSNDLRALAYGNGRFVAVGGFFSAYNNPLFRGAIVSSLDGVTWTSQNFGTNVHLSGVAYGNGQFVAVGFTGTNLFGATATILSSPDGSNWTARTGANALVRAVAYGNGRFVGVGDTVVTSPDGITWTVTDPGTLNPMNGIAYGNGLFAAAEYDAVATSPDGVTWTQHTWRYPPSPIDRPMTMTWGNGLFVLAGLDFQTPELLTSPDGVTWTERYPGVWATITGVAYGGMQFVAVGFTPAGATILVSSSDGINWIQRNASMLGWVAGVGYGNGHFVAAGGSAIWESDEIIALTRVSSPGGMVRGTITGVAGKSYLLQASTNLSAWVPLTNVTTAADATAQFADPSSTNFPLRFYRVVASP